MTQDEIIDRDKVLKMARQAGFNVSGELIIDDMGYVTITNRLEAFAKLVALNERERLAIVFDKRDTGTGFYEPHEPAEIIRAQGEPTSRGET